MLPLHADKVTLTTALSVGEHLALAVNADAIVKLTWSDGSEETLESDGALLSLEVKGNTLTITSDDPLTSLYVQGNRLTALDVKEAPYLEHLLCADNELQQLDLTKNAALKVLDAQGNALTAVSVSNAKALESVNVAGNKLSKLTLATNARPVAVVCADNQLASLPSATILSKVQYLWTQNNSVKVLPIAQDAQLRGLNASGNELETINFASTPQLREVWLSHNNLQTVNLSKSSPLLYSLVVNDNALHTLVWDKNSKRSVKYVALQRNALCLNSMPSLVFGGVALNLDASEQQPYALPKQVYEVGETVDINSLVSANGWGVSTFAQVSVVDEQGKALAAGTDYSVSNNSFTFKSVFKGLHFNITSSAYSGYEFATSTFNVGTTEGIAAVDAQPCLGVQAGKGSVTLTLSAPATVQVVNAAGLRVVHTSLSAGTHQLSLPAGIYIVNGQKVLVK